MQEHIYLTGDCCHVYVLLHVTKADFLLLVWHSLGIFILQPGVVPIFLALNVSDLLFVKDFRNCPIFPIPLAREGTLRDMANQTSKICRCVTF